VCVAPAVSVTDPLPESLNAPVHVPFKPPSSRALQLAAPLDTQVKVNAVPHTACWVLDDIVTAGAGAHCTVAVVCADNDPFWHVSPYVTGPICVSFTMIEPEYGKVPVQPSPALPPVAVQDAA
jgi:hypothetical protein